MRATEHNQITSYLLRTLFSVMLLSAVSACATTKIDKANLSQIYEPFKLLKPGYSYLQLISGPGATREITWVFKGKEGDLYRWDLFRNRDTSIDPWRIQWYNINGSSVRQRQAKATANWSPHNCFRVLGECSFTYKDDFGIENKYVRRSSFDGMVWVYKLYRVKDESRSLVTNGEAHFDTNGIEIFHEYFTDNNGHQLSKVTEIF